MKFTLSTVIAAAGFLPLISAHLVMIEPKQWNVPYRQGATVETSDSNQHPLQGDGSNYPCHGVPPEEPVATWQPGSTQQLKLKGSAIHSGGSGQMSITYETQPNKNTVFRVMQSWQGGHPISHDGNLPPNAEHPLPAIPFTVPKDLPAGKAVVAW